MGKKALQLSADRFGKLNALRSEGIHLGSEKRGGVALLQSRRFSELACCAGEDPRHAQQKQRGSQHRQHHTQPVQHQTAADAAVAR